MTEYKTMSDKKDEKVNIKVTISEGLTVDRALKKFKRLCDSYGIVKEYRKREAYTKPSVKMKEKHEAAEKRRKKAMVKSMRFSKKI
jgi:small subunit ribosomal protein S21